MTFEYLVIELVGEGETKVVSSNGGFPTEEDAQAAGEQEASRIASSEIDPLKRKTYSVDVRKQSELASVAPSGTGGL
jgi:hypothetical protein